MTFLYIQHRLTSTAPTLLQCYQLYPRPSCTLSHQNASLRRSQSSSLASLSLTLGSKLTQRWYKRLLPSPLQTILLCLFQREWHTVCNLWASVGFIDVSLTNCHQSKRHCGSSCSKILLGYGNRLRRTHFKKSSGSCRRPQCWCLLILAYLIFSEYIGSFTGQSGLTADQLEPKYSSLERIKNRIADITLIMACVLRYNRIYDQLLDGRHSIGLNGIHPVSASNVTTVPLVNSLQLVT
jgi:hypothetical protein